MSLKHNTFLLTHKFVTLCKKSVLQRDLTWMIWDSCTCIFMDGFSLLVFVRICFLHTQTQAWFCLLNQGDLMLLQNTLTMLQNNNLRTISVLTARTEVCKHLFATLWHGGVIRNGRVIASIQSTGKIMLVFDLCFLYSMVSSQSFLSVTNFPSCMPFSHRGSLTCFHLFLLLVYHLFSLYPPFLSPFLLHYLPEVKIHAICVGGKFCHHFFYIIYLRSRSMPFVLVGSSVTISSTLSTWGQDPCHLCWWEVLSPFLLHYLPEVKIHAICVGGKFCHHFFNIIYLRSRSMPFVLVGS